MGTMVREFKVRSSTLILVCLVLFAILITGIFSGLHHSYGVTTFEKLLLVTGLLSCLLYVFSVARGQEMRRRFDEYRFAEGKLQESAERLQSLLQNISDVILVLEADGTIRYLSPSIERVLGHRPDELLGRSIASLVYPADLNRVQSFFAERPVAGEGPAPTEFRLRHRDGSWRHVEAVANNLLREPSVNGIVITVRDVTERKRIEERLQHQAFHDPVTGLANRALFMDRLSHALAGSSRGQEPVAVMFIDLDRFKLINDSLGHGVGDHLLVAVAQRLSACLRPGDTIARFGGDEFTVLLESVTHPSIATRVAQRFVETLSRPFPLAGHELFVTASIGIALNAPEPARPADLLRDADVALYRAKDVGGASYVMFDAGMNALAVERLDFEADLRRAIEREEFRLYYQPDIDLGTRAIVGMEALIRWQHPQRGLLSPSEFIPLAEETGLILPIGQWVLETACRQACEWQVLRPTGPALVMSVNLSVRQFEQPDLVERVAETLRATGLSPACLKLELTESMLMQDTEATIRMFHRLKQLGVQLAIDDFGTGYSSLSYLQRFAVDTLKVDQSFVRDLGHDAGAIAIVQAVTTVAHALGMDVTAEGIEQDVQAEGARALHCDRGQGYLFSRPVPAEALKALLLDACIA